MSIVNTVALSTEKPFFNTLRRYPPGPVLDFLTAAREHELDSGFREEWLQQSKAHRELLADTITQRQGPLAARDIALRYEEFRLRVRPLLLVLMTLYMNSDGFLHDRVIIENRELLVRSQRTGRPLVLAGTHFGLYVGLGIALATLGHRVTGVLARYEKPLIDDLLETYCPKGRANLTLVSVPDRWVLVRCRNALRWRPCSHRYGGERGRDSSQGHSGVPGTPGARTRGPSIPGLRDRRRPRPGRVHLPGGTLAGAADP